VLKLETEFLRGSVAMINLLRWISAISFECAAAAAAAGGGGGGSGGGAPVKANSSSWMKKRVLVV